MRTPGIDRYFNATREILDREATVLTRALPHPGERGRGNEERFRRFLAKVLPKKFSLGTGFAVCSDRAVAASSQIDIVVFDEVSNSPLAGDGEAKVFPVEMVYAAIEVRSTFLRHGLRRFLSEVATIRAMARTKRYAYYEFRDKRVGKRIGVPRDFPAPLAPRCYYVCYDSRSAASLAKLVAILEAEAAAAPGAHLHGILVLKQNWFAYQKAHVEPPRFTAFDDDALLHFTRRLLHDVASFPMSAMSVDPYFDVGGK